MRLKDYENDKNSIISNNDNSVKFNIGNTIDISKIKVPLLSLVEDKDTLVAKEFSFAIDVYIQSKEKEVFTIPHGHVALSMSNTAHRDL